MRVGNINPSFVQNWPTSHTKSRQKHGAEIFLRESKYSRPCKRNFGMLSGEHQSLEAITNCWHWIEKRLWDAKNYKIPIFYMKHQYFTWNISDSELMKMTAQNHFSKHDLVNPAWKLCNQEDDMAGEVIQKNHILEYMYLSSTQHLVSQIDITLNEVFWVGHHSLSLWNMTIELDIVVKNLLNKCFLHILLGILSGDLISRMVFIRHDVGQFWVDLSAGLFGLFVGWYSWVDITTRLLGLSEFFFFNQVRCFSGAMLANTEWILLPRPCWLGRWRKEVESHWYLPEFSPTFQHYQVSMISTRILTNISARLGFNDSCPKSHQHFSTIKFPWYLPEYSPTFQHN